MSGYDPAGYGHAVGGDYDSLYPGDDRESVQAVELLAGLARRCQQPNLLEFGIGTGRLALGLQRAGIHVEGLDGSPAMIEQLRAKPGGTDIPVVVGDYRTGRVDGRFAVVVLAINGIFDPRGIDAQLDIFVNAARHLAVGGTFVVESWVMNEAQRNGDWSVIPRFVGDEHVELQLARYDINTNTIERTLVHLLPAGPKYVTVTDTYASPGELDVIAHVTGFEREARYANWARDTYTSTSTRHVTVYRALGEPDRDLRAVIAPDRQR